MWILARWASHFFVNSDLRQAVFQCAMPGMTHLGKLRVAINVRRLRDRWSFSRMNAQENVTDELEADRG